MFYLKENCSTSAMYFYHTGGLVKEQNGKKNEAAEVKTY